MNKPIKIVGNHVVITQNHVVNFKLLSQLTHEQHLHKNSIYWKNKAGPSHKKKAGTLKSFSSSHIIDLRQQYRPICCNVDNYDPSLNEIVDMLGDSTQDYEYVWHFVHRHNFPSDLHGSGRGQANKVKDIVNHPLSYMLMCNKHHEQYDRENGEWKNPYNHNEHK